MEASRISRAPASAHAYTSIMPSRIAQVAIDAEQPQLLAEFWCAVLGWVVHEVEEDVVWCIGPTDRSWPGIDIGPAQDAKSRKSRLHLDLRADGVSTEDELERLLALGARTVNIGQGPDVSWTVLADPEGNEFCLLKGTVQEQQATIASSAEERPAETESRPPGRLS